MIHKAGVFVLTLFAVFTLSSCDKILGPNVENFPIAVVNGTEKTGDVIVDGKPMGIVLEPGDSRQFEVEARVEDRYSSGNVERAQISIHLRNFHNPTDISEVERVRVREDKIITIVFERWNRVRVF